MGAYISSCILDWSPGNTLKADHTAAPDKIQFSFTISFPPVFPFPVQLVWIAWKIFLSCLPFTFPHKSSSHLFCMHKEHCTFLSEQEEWSGPITSFSSNNSKERSISKSHFLRYLFLSLILRFMKLLLTKEALSSNIINLLGACSALLLVLQPWKSNCSDMCHKYNFSVLLHVCITSKLTYTTCLNFSCVFIGMSILRLLTKKHF